MSKSKLDEILTAYKSRRPVTVEENPRTEAKQQIKDLFKELIGPDMRAMSHSNQAFIDGKNNEKDVLRNKVDKL